MLFIQKPNRPKNFNWLTPFWVRTLLLLVSAPLITVSCNDENAPDCFKSTGGIVKQKRLTGRFSQILLYDNIDLFLTTGTDSAIAVEAGKNLLPNIQTLQTGDSLIIRNTNQCNWVRSYRKPLTVTLVIPPQTDLHLIHYGYGLVKSLDSLHLNYLSIASFDAGGDISLHGHFNYTVVYSNSIAHITLAGRAEGTEIWLNKAIGRVSAEKLVSQTCVARHSGSNEIRVFPVKELQAEITENGTIGYYNEPLKLSSKITGKGKLVKM